MMAILVGNSTSYLFNTMIFIPGLIAALILAGMNNAFVLIPGGIVLLASLLPVFMLEQYEEKNHGYSFFAILPVKTSEIVISKFFLAATNTIAFVGVSYVLLSLVGFSADLLELTRGLSLISGNLSLLLIALIYIGIYRFGFTSFIKIFITLTLIINMLFFFSTNFIGSTKAFWDGIINFARNSNWLLLSTINLAIYILFMYLALKIKENTFYN